MVRLPNKCPEHLKNVKIIPPPPPPPKKDCNTIIVIKKEVK
jgi:hypothetical protein